MYSYIIIALYLNASVEVGEDGFDDFGRRVKRAGVDAVSAGASEKNRLRREKELAALARLKTTYGFLLPSSAADETGDEGIMGDLAPGASKSGDQIGDDNGEMTHNNILQSLASKKGQSDSIHLRHIDDELPTTV